LTNTYEAPFQDGRVAKVVNQVAAKGILVVSSSGNFGNDARQTSQVWEGDFTASGAVWPGTQDLLHTFQLADGIAGRSNVVYPTDPASNDPLLACPPGQLPSGAYVPTAVAILTWNDPLGSTTDDYGLYVIDSSSSPRFLYQGSTLPTQPNNPLKLASVLPNSVVVITKKPAAQQRHLRLTVVGSCGRLKYATAGQTFGHNAAASVITVGAVSARNRTTPFDNTVSVDGGSSDGPRRMYFAADGTAYTPTDFTKTGGKLLLKPDLVAASGVMTSVTNYKPFAGSSAAAPHVAAIAALVWSYKPALTAAEVRLALVGSAIDIETQGWDETSGYGIPMADRALRVAGTVGDPAFMNQLSRNYTARSLATSQGHYLVLLNNGSVGAFVVGVEMSGNGVVVAPIWQGIPSLPIVEPVAVGFDNDDALVLNKDGSLVRWRPAWPN
jgi:subtilisin family serine protease